MKLIVAAAALVATASAYTTPSLHRALQHRRPLAARVVRRQAAGGDESIASPEVESTTVAAAVSDEEDFELFEPAVAPAPTRKPWEVEPGAGAYKGDAGAFLGSASGGGAIQKGGEANGEEDGKQLRVVLYIGLSLAPILFLLPFLSNRELKPLDQATIDEMMGVQTTPIVREAPVKAAADPWKQYTDEASGRPYFYNAESGETSWAHP